MEETAKAVWNGAGGGGRTRSPEPRIGSGRRVPLAAAAVLMTVVVIMTAISICPGEYEEGLEGVTIDSGKCGENASWTLDSGDDGTVLTISGTGSTVELFGDSYWAGIQGEWRAVIEDGITSVGYHLFNGCTSLTEVTIPDTVTGLWWGAFEGCSSLTDITIPNSVTFIDSDIFKGCGLTEISIPSSITQLGGSTFANCKALTKVIIQGPTISILPTDFTGCTALEEVEFGSLESLYGVDAFSYPFYEKDGTEPLTTAEELSDSTFRLDPASKRFIKMPRHSVEYVSNGGIGSVPVQSDVAEGSKFIVQDYTGSMTGFRFEGWSWNGTVYQAGDYAVMGDSNMVLTAVWKKEITIAFYQNGGDWSGPRIEYHLSGDSIDLGTIAPPTRESYTFKGWSCDGRMYSAEEKITVLTNMTFTAQWEADGSSDPVTPIIPIFPGDEQEPIEVVTIDKKGGSWLGQNGKTVVLMGIVVAIIAELAVLSISRRG